MLKISLDTAAINEELEKYGRTVGELLEDAVIAGGMVIADEAVQILTDSYVEDEEGNAKYAKGTLASSTGAAPRITRLSTYTLEGEIGPRGVPYARIQELGGVTGRGHKTRLYGKFYMNRAALAKTAEAGDKMIQVITEGINRRS
jgi:hypothetical protein